MEVIPLLRLGLLVLLYFPPSSSHGYLHRAPLLLSGAGDHHHHLSLQLGATLPLLLLHKHLLLLSLQAQLGDLHHLHQLEESPSTSTLPSSSTSEAKTTKVNLVLINFVCVMMI